MARSKPIIPIGRIEQRIVMIRGQRVMLDADLAGLYGTTTGRLNQQVRRNPDRFPEDFMFQLTKGEFGNLKSQSVISSSAWGGRRTLPYAFTEHGAIMAASVLSTDRAVQVSVYVVRAFVKQRQMLANQKELTEWLVELQGTVERHDHDILVLIDVLDRLMACPSQVAPQRRRRPIGFKTEGEGDIAEQDRKTKGSRRRSSTKKRKA
jgi:hypothetical protein